MQASSSQTVQSQAISDQVNKETQVTSVDVHTNPLKNESNFQSILSSTDVHEHVDCNHDLPNVGLY